MHIEWRDMDAGAVEWLEIPVGGSVDFYELLEVSPRASAEVIKRAYRVLAERYHPDKHTVAHKPWADEMMKLVNVAYSTLSDEQRRRTYDVQSGHPSRQR
jgi:DnaJ-class molecular chaperone